MSDLKFDEMVEKYITAHFELMEYGSPEIRQLARLLLSAIDDEVRRLRIASHDRLANWIALEPLRPDLPV